MTKPKILIVDDEPLNVDYLEQELEELDYETVSAFDGQEALDKVIHDPPDMILLDIMMPVMDGFQVLRRLKTETTTRDIPVVVISANSDLKSIVRGIELGAEDYLPKPFEPALLRARISSCLDKKRLRDLEHLYQKNLERELEIGREIQQGFLPSKLPRVDGWELAAYFKAAREVAGDFYDSFLLPDGNLLCVIGDVCDKGVGAALFMTLFRSLIRITALNNIGNNGQGMDALDPKIQLMNILSFTNNYIVNTHGEAGMFATIFLGILNLENDTFAYINGGHEPVFWISEYGEILPLPPTGPMVGIILDAEYEPREILLKKNDLILAFTDGVPDAINDKQEFFRKERLLQLVKTNAKNPTLLVEAIVTKLFEFTGQAYPFDDITLLAVQKTG